MKILFSAEKPLQFNNPFINELAESLSQYNSNVECLLKPQIFWDNPAAHSIDLLHIHWPEDLTGWATPTREKLQKLEQQLLKWKRKVPVVLTVHNITPHNSNKFKSYLYKLIYQNVEHFIHMGKASISLLKQAYSLSPNSTHTVIPHLMYTSYRTDIDKEEARGNLNIVKNDFVVLAFGSIRKSQEKKLLLESFRDFNQENKKLVVTKPVFSNFFLFRWIEKYRYDRDKRIQVFNKKISNKEVSYFLASSDIVFIQRVDALNSGSLILGYCFQKVVVGPDIGVIGEILKKTGNPTFNPSDIKTVVQALEKAKKLAWEGKGRENYEYATTYWNKELVAKKHARLYKILSNR